MNHYITGYNLIQPKAIDAPLAMNLGDEDAETIRKCREAVEAIAAERVKVAAKNDEPHGVYSASDLGIDFLDLELMP
jgi:hypothetical protein